MHKVFTIGDDPQMAAVAEAWRAIPGDLRAVAVAVGGIPVSLYIGGRPSWRTKPDLDLLLNEFAVERLCPDRVWDRRAGFDREFCTAASDDSPKLKRYGSPQGGQGLIHSNATTIDVFTGHDAEVTFGASAVASVNSGGVPFDVRVATPGSLVFAKLTGMRFGGGKWDRDLFADPSVARDFFDVAAMVEKLSGKSLVRSLVRSSVSPRFRRPAEVERELVVERIDMALGGVDFGIANFDTVTSLIGASFGSMPESFDPVSNLGRLGEALRTERQQLLDRPLRSQSTSL